MSTTTEAIARAAIGSRMTCVVVALALLGAGPATAAPAATVDEADRLHGASAPAVEAGDLSSARELAEAARKADPSADNWRREAVVCAELADYGCARVAWQEYLKAAPAGGERTAAEGELAKVEKLSLGAVEDEGPATRRAALDKARADKLAALRPRPEPKDDVRPATPRRQPIVRKWYFWVTMVAIAAAAGAITGIAVQAARDEQADDLDERARLTVPPPQPFGLHF
jgi:hypothetical protein